MALPATYKPASAAPESLYYGANAAAAPAPATAPKVDAGVIGGAMNSFSTVSGANTAGGVAQIDKGAFGNMTPNGQAEASTWKVDPSQTVESRVTGIINKDSELSQQAATRATQTAAKRGLINSSMAVQAGHAAVLDAAMPIATADAATFADAAKTNAALGTDVSKTNAASKNALQSQQIDNMAKADFTNAAAKNSANQFDAQTKVQAEMANQDASLKQATQRYDSEVKAAMQNADAQSRLQLQQIDAATRQQLAQIEAQYKSGMQTSSSMAQTYQGMIDSITKIMGDKELDAESKQAAINNIGTLYGGALQVQQNISGLDLGGILTFGPGGNAPAPAPGAAPAPGNIYVPPAPPAPAPAPYAPPSGGYYGGGGGYYETAP